MHRIVFFLLAIIFIFGLLFAVYPQNMASSVKHPDWAYNKTIYEVNLRQYSKTGSITEFTKHLPRLDSMGVGILWLMPIHPIGVKNRKGTLGSYYSVKDYYGLDPMIGTKKEFKKFVKTVHEYGMHVIIDWVANHSAWDNDLTKKHPEFYSRDSLGHFVPPVPDWSDVIDLNYDNHKLWKYMAGALEYWVKEFDIDGYRCDVAGMVPTEFWNYVRPKLEKIKPVFMLAEWEDPALHAEAFDMTYSWNLYHKMINVAQGKASANSIIKLVESELPLYPADAYRMRFTTNHDENSWNSTSIERFGNAVETYNLLAATLPGMYLIYSGQEAGEKKRLSFFERDPINWTFDSSSAFFQKIVRLKENNPSLWNGIQGGEFHSLATDTTSSIISFVRYAPDNSVIVCANLGDKETTTLIAGKWIKGNLHNAFSDKTKSNMGVMEIRLKPYEYQVWIRK